METLVKQSNNYTYFWWVLPQYRGRGQIVKSQQNTYQAVIISAVVSKLQHQIIFNVIVQQRFCDIPHASKSMTVHPSLSQHFKYSQNSSYQPHMCSENYLQTFFAQNKTKVCATLYSSTLHTLYLPPLREQTDNSVCARKRSVFVLQPQLSVVILDIVERRGPL